MSEPEKLAAYKEMICYLTDYNDDAVSGSYKKIATIKSGSTVKYTNTGLKKGNKYYYRIRAYSYNALGNKVYSGWSAVKSKTSK